MNKSIRIKFNKKLYKKSAIMTSISSFVDVSEFSFQDAGDSYVVDIENCPSGSSDIIKKEFSNHVLYLTGK